MRDIASKCEPFYFCLSKHPQSQHHENLLRNMQIDFTSNNVANLKVFPPLNLEQECKF